MEGRSAVGLMFLRDQGAERDEVAAASWTTLAAEQGLAPATAQLGTLYSEGRGVDR